MVKIHDPPEVTAAVERLTEFAEARRRGAAWASARRIWHTDDVDDAFAKYAADDELVRKYDVRLLPTDWSHLLDDDRCDDR